MPCDHDGSRPDPACHSPVWTAPLRLKKAALNCGQTQSLYLYTARFLYFHCSTNGTKCRISNLVKPTEIIIYRLECEPKVEIRPGRKSGPLSCFGSRSRMKMSARVRDRKSRDFSAVVFNSG